MSSGAIYGDSSVINFMEFYQVPQRCILLEFFISSTTFVFSTFDLIFSIYCTEFSQQTNCDHLETMTHCRMVISCGQQLHKNSHCMQTRESIVFSEKRYQLQVTSRIFSVDGRYTSPDKTIPSVFSR